MPLQDPNSPHKISLITDPDHIDPPSPFTEIQIDIAHDCTLGEFLDALGALKGEIVNFLPRGPAGGNPFLTLIFPTPEDALTFQEQVKPNSRLSVVSVVETPIRSQEDQPE